MCLAAIAIGQSKRWPLIIASNRDEFFDRPALPLARWQSSTDQSIISGRDLRAGGSWFGLTPTGRVALLTNVREAPAHGLEDLQSRGDLVLRWLAGQMNASDFMQATDSAAYAGFNLLVGDIKADRWHWLSNRAAPSQTGKLDQLAQGWAFQALSTGIYGLSNAALDTPWPKTQALKARLHSVLNIDAAASTDALEDERLKTQLWSALANREKANLQALPNTGISAELELALSSAFIDQPERGLAGYGTRVSSILALQPIENSTDWAMSIEEKTHHRQTEATLARCSVRWPLA